MSIVGPRPQSLRNFSAYSKDVQKIITHVSPGLTGLGSIFFSNEEAMLKDNIDHDKFYDTIIMPYKGRLEIWYVRNATLIIDIKIIYLTAQKIIFPSMQLDLSKHFKGVASPPKTLKNLKLN